jgi:hypothetical protein
MRKRDGRFNGESIIFELCHIVTRLSIEKAPFFNINDINDISFLGTPDCHHCCSIAKAGMLIL